MNGKLRNLAHPGDKGRCLLPGYIECASKIDAGCICEKMPHDVARMYYRKKYDHGPDDENKTANLVMNRREQ